MKTFRPGNTWRFEGTPKLKPRLIIVCAPSGAGKSTLCAKLVREFPEIIENVSFTTRPRRGKEEDGVDYFFIDKPEFEEKKSRGFFVESAEVHGNLYGVSYAQIETAVNAGRAMILDIDVQGAKTLTKKFPDALTIFVMPPSLDELRRRLETRDNGKTNNFDLRLANAKTEIGQADFFRFKVVNDELERAYGEFKKIVENELGTS